jgi:oxygen-dependent protoporphyrinogen oxidase
MGGAGNPEAVHLDQEELVDITLKEYDRVLGITGDPDYIKIRKWPRAIPQYNIGYEKYNSMMKSLETNNPGLFLSGNFRGGISISDCIVQSDKTSDHVIHYLKDIGAIATNG